MAGSVSIQCSKCKAKLKLKNPKAVGKKVPCPKCKQPFVVKPLPEPEDDDDFLSNLDSFDEDYAAPDEDYAAPALPPIPGRRSSSKQNTRKPSEPVHWQKLALIAGGGLLGVALLGGLVWVAVSALSGSGSDNRLDLSYLPPDSELIVSIRVADAWNAPILESLLNKPEVQKNIGEMREKIGLEPADIQSVIIGFSGLLERQKQSAQQNMMQAGGPIVPLPDFDDLPGIMVVRTSKAIDKQKLLDYAEKAEEIPIEKIETVSHAGETYYRIPNPGEGGPKSAGVFFPNEKTIVFGPEEDVKSAIERGSQTEARPDMDFIDLDQHFLIALVPKDLSAFAEQSPMSRDDASEAEKKLDEALQEALKGFSFGLTLTDGIDFQLQFDCLDSDRAGQIKTHLDVVLDETFKEGRQILAETKKELAADTKQATSPVWRELVELAETMIDSVQAEQSSTTVVVRAAVPGSAGSTLAKIPQAIAEVFSQGTFVIGDAAGPGGVGIPEFGEFDMTDEPEPRKPATAETVPEGRISKKLSLSFDKPFAFHVFPPDDVKPLFATLELSGKAAAEATRYGFLELTSVSDDKGKYLKLLESDSAFSDPTKTFVKIDGFARKKGTLKIHFMLQHPDTDAALLTRCEGSVMLLTGGKRKIVTVPGVSNKLGTTLTAPALKQAGLRVKLQKPDKDEVDDPAKAVSVIVNGPGLRQLTLVDSAGSKLSMGTSSFSFGSRTTYSLESERKLRPDDKLKLVLLSGQKPVKVPFRFPNAQIGGTTAEKTPMLVRRKTSPDRGTVPASRRVAAAGRSDGKLLQFNGKDAYITAAAIPFDSYNTLTIEAWLKDWKGPILCQGMAGDPENSIWMSIGPRRTTKPHETCGWESGKGKNYQFSVGDKLPASWNHLALVYDGKQQLIFVNGRLTRRAPAPKPGPLNKTRQFLIGTHDYGRKWNYGSGLLRSVRVSKTLRYNAQFAPAQRLTADGDTVLLYNFSRGQGMRVSDQAGGKRGGTIHGAVWVK